MIFCPQCRGGLEEQHDGFVVCEECLSEYELKITNDGKTYLKRTDGKLYMPIAWVELTNENSNTTNNGVS